MSCFVGSKNTCIQLFVCQSQLFVWTRADDDDEEAVTGEDNLSETDVGVVYDNVYKGIRGM